MNEPGVGKRASVSERSALVGGEHLVPPLPVAEFRLGNAPERFVLSHHMVRDLAWLVPQPVANDGCECSANRARRQLQSPPDVDVGSVVELLSVRHRSTQVEVEDLLGVIGHVCCSGPCEPARYPIDTVARLHDVLGRRDVGIYPCVVSFRAVPRGRLRGQLVNAAGAHAHASLRRPWRLEAHHMSRRR